MTNFQNGNQTNEKRTLNIIKGSTPLQLLQYKLDLAVAKERYEEAEILYSQIVQLGGK
ncbi:MAG: hypothetical protein R3Y32_03015 [Bacillota bacterium]